MFKLVRIIICGLVCLMFGGCSKVEEPISDETPNMGGGMMVVNPWVEYSSLKEAGEATGINLEVSEDYDGFEVSFINAMSDLVQIRLVKDEKEINVRKSNSSYDAREISGDYNSYDTTKTVSINGNDVTLEGNDETISLAYWVKENEVFAINFTNMSEDEVTYFLESVK